MMKKYILSFSIPTVIFLCIIALIVVKNNDNDVKILDINKLQKQAIELNEKLEIQKLFSNDLNFANNELNTWASRGAKQSKFWNDFVNPELNIALGHTPKSSSSVNTEINKLLSYLRRNFENRNIKLGRPSKGEFFNNFSSPSPPKKYGFGFSMYDGFWPSFDKTEANKILVQAKILKEMCEFLLGSFAPNESFRLLSIHREPAGTEDLKHIQENQYSSSGKARLLRDSGLVSSYAFQVSFTGKTSNCRTFINQLRSPYSLRSLKVQRQEERESENILKSPEESSDNLEKSLLPIIRDITSVFFLDIEYVYEVKSNLSEHIARQLGAEIKSEKTQEILGQFK